MNWSEFGSILLVNLAAVVLAIRWSVNRAIDYTHLQRDVKELHDFKKLTEARHEKNLEDLKGLSIKIDKVKNEGLGFRLKD